MVLSHKPINHLGNTCYHCFQTTSTVLGVTPKFHVPQLYIDTRTLDRIPLLGPLKHFATRNGSFYTEWVSKHCDFLFFLWIHFNSVEVFLFMT